MKLAFVVEGETEELLVKRLLRTHLFEHGVTIELTQLVVARTNSWGVFENDLKHLLRRFGRDRQARVTTVYDLYAIDKKRLAITDELARANIPSTKAQIAEQAMSARIGDDRFIPHVSLYELETLIFADLSKVIDRLPECSAGLEQLNRDVRGLQPEQINDRPETSPSHRLLAATSGRYRKTTEALAILSAIGLPAIRSKCPHFDAWLTQLEALGGASA